MLGLISVHVFGLSLVTLGSLVLGGFCLSSLCLH